MEIKNEISGEINHKNYLEFEKSQLICELDKNESVVIQVKDKEGKIIKESIFIAKYINCHFAFTFQDKGIKFEEPIKEWKLVPKE